MCVCLRVWRCALARYFKTCILTDPNDWIHYMRLFLCVLMCFFVCVCVILTLNSPSNQIIRERLGYWKGSTWGQYVCLCVCVTNIHKVIHNTFQSHYSLWKWVGRVMGAGACIKYVWMEKLDKREREPSIRWLLAYIKRNIAKRIKGIGRADGHGRGSLWETNKRRDVSVEGRWSSDHK